VSNDETASTTSGTFVNGHAIKAMNARQTKKASKKVERLIDWNVDVLSKLLRQIVATRCVLAKEERLLEDWPTSFSEYNEAVTPFDEVQEIISIPAYNEAIGLLDETEYALSETVQTQLRDFVSRIVSRPFCFSHRLLIKMKGSSLQQ
jgi:hypothetical protein